MYEINLAKRLSQAWVHFVTDRASLLTDHRMSGLPILAKCKHFQTMRILQIILQLIQALPFCFDCRPNKGLKLETVALPFYSPNRNDISRIFEHVLLRHTPCFIPVMNNLTFSVSLVLLEAFQNECIFHLALCVSQCLLLCHDEFAMVSFLSSCLGSFSLERSTSCQVILEVFFEFLKWLNHPIVDLHRIYRIGHLFHMV